MGDLDRLLEARSRFTVPAWAKRHRPRAAPFPRPCPRRARPLYAIAASIVGATASALALIMPLGPVGPLLAQPAAPPSDQDLPFSAHFEEAIEPLGPDLQDYDPLIPDTAVDLDTFTPPIEQPPAPPTGIIRDLGTGVASYYGRRFHGRLTANGERFNMRAMTAAHKTLPFGSLVRVTNARNGRSVTVRINDRGPFIRGRHIDLSRAAAQQIGMISSGHARVTLELVAP